MLEIEEVVLWWFQVVHCQRWRLLVQYYWVLRLIGVILYIYLLIFVLRPFSFLQEERLNIRRWPCSHCCNRFLQRIRLILLLSRFDLWFSYLILTLQQTYLLVAILKNLIKPSFDILRDFLWIRTKRWSFKFSHLNNWFLSLSMTAFELFKVFEFHTNAIAQMIHQNLFVLQRETFNQPKIHLLENLPMIRLYALSGFKTGGSSSLPYSIEHIHSLKRR